MTTPESLSRHITRCRNTAIVGSAIACAVTTYIRYGPELKGQDAVFAVFLLFVGLILFAMGILCAAIPLEFAWVNAKLRKIRDKRNPD